MVVEAKSNFEKYSKSAENGDSVAQFEIGKCYEYGSRGVLEDYNLALEWYLKSAKKGYPPAQFRIGEILEYGKLFAEKNVEQSYNWYRLSAEQGHWQAQNKLVNLYFLGKGGVKKDYIHAYAWHVVSKAFAPSPIGFGHPLLKNKMSKEDIFKAQELAKKIFERIKENKKNGPLKPLESAK